MYTLVYRCLHRTQFHTELTFLRGVFCKNGYPETFINKCFKLFLYNIHLVKEKILTMEKKHLHLVLQLNCSTTKLQKALTS